MDQQTLARYNSWKRKKILRWSVKNFIIVLAGFAVGIFWRFLQMLH